ncbi:MAG: TIGR04282 family arsenosugar biosynthesis glycosyltransferase [Acetobacteraceae bacterium]
MKDVAILFARAPRLGRVKRRLAADIGARAALRFHAETLRRLLWALARERRFRTVLALTPDRAFLRIPPGVARIDQGRGDLGTRMARAIGRFPRRRVVLLGSDIPEAGAADVIGALGALGRARAVFGPAADGGFWLVGFGPLRIAAPFRGVRWSVPQTLADALARQRGRKVAFVRTLSDVDRAADLLRLRGRARYPAPARCGSASRSRSDPPRWPPPPARSPG